MAAFSAEPSDFAYADAVSTVDTQALARVEKALHDFDAVEMTFVQERIDKAGVAHERTHGTLQLQKPNRFRWTYVDPAQVIVADGVSLWLYDPDLAQVTVRRLTEALNQTPALLLAGRGHVADGYTASMASSVRGLDWVVLVPKDAAREFRSLRLGFKGDALRGLEFEDALNEVTRIEFGQIHYGMKFKEGVFQFTPPAGVDVIGRHP
jgi:outer membrane lipoprotein carrier protein